MTTQTGKESILLNEDQLFFGLVITVLIFLLQFPTFDLAKIFENFGTKIPSTIGINTQMVVIFLLILSSGARYVAILSEKLEDRNKRRMIAVTFLLACIYFEIFDLIIRGLTAVLTGVNIFLIFLSPIILSIVSIILGFTVERKWISYYGYKEPINAIIFGSIGITIIIAYYLVMLVSLFTPLSSIITTVLMIVSFFITFLVLRLGQYINEKRKKETGVKVKKNYNLLVSKWFYYALIAILLLSLIVFATYGASIGNDFANRFLPTLIGLFFTFSIFIVFFDAREELEWKGVEERVHESLRWHMKKILSESTYLLEFPSELLEVQTKDLKDWDRGYGKSLLSQAKHLSEKKPEEAKLSEVGEKFLRSEGLEDYDRFCSRELAEIDLVMLQFERFWKPELISSLMQLRNDLRGIVDLVFVKDDFENFLSLILLPIHALVRDAYNIHNMVI